MPRLAPPRVLPVIGNLVDSLLGPELQRQAFGRGLLPQPAAEFGVTAEGALSPAERAVVETLLPAPVADTIVQTPLIPLLSADRLAYIIRRWDEQIGAQFRRPR